MALSDIKLKSGKWLVANCGSMPSESNCQVVIMAPEGQKDDLLAATTKHAVDKHGHKDDDKLWSEIEGTIEAIEV